MHMHFFLNVHRGCLAGQGGGWKGARGDFLGDGDTGGGHSGEYNSQNSLTLNSQGITFCYM